MGCRLGNLVGYAVRFDDNTTPSTRVKYMTDGLLLRELLTSNALEAYSCVVLDEAHERSINSDVLLGLLKELAEKRPDLKIVIMSATLNAEMFSRFWNNCPIGYIEGRAFPVDVFYTAEPVQNIVDAAVTTVVQIHVDHPQEDGDILVFLTGQDTIEDCTRLLQEKVELMTSDDKQLLVIPLYANLAPERQARAFVPAPAGKRKVILATNVAETSLTLPNIRYVVDCGLVKEKRYNARTGMDSLLEVEVSQAQAKQRSGRAGRVQAGKCYRMYTEEGYLHLNPTTQPEIQRVNLSSVILQLKQLGVNDPLSFSFVDPPNKDHLVAALHLLFILGALDKRGKITKIGEQIGAYPLTPTHGKALLVAESLGVFEEVVSIVSMLSVENVMSNPTQHERAAADKKRQAFSSPHGDHLTLLNLLNDYRKQKTQRDKSDWCKRVFINPRKILQVLDVKKQLTEVHTALRKRDDFEAVQVSAPALVTSEEKAEGDAASIAAPEEDSTAAKMEAVLRSDKTAAIRKTFCYGFFFNVAQYNLDRKVYVTAEGKHEVAIHPTSVLFKLRYKPPLLLFNELVYTKKRYMRDVVSIEEAWLAEAAPGKWKRS
eukprot:TRINITY_DN28771_c0_g1_i1.p1 TRINITY_DN28771_c0_g1~~TRINITY_DN28771_c0_g1_i1.p1  ORF type:complete len:691 (+),score=317.28 TRINITY_DN28771_c0_g1_i1:274-2073(+)